MSVEFVRKKTCPKCQNEQENFFQCQNCGLVFDTDGEDAKGLWEKFKNKNFLLMIYFVLITFYGVVSFDFEAYSYQFHGLRHNKDIVLLSTKSCGYCAMARSYLDGYSIPYIELDIEYSTKGRKIFDKLNGRGVPLILVGPVLMRGYDQAQFEKILQPYMMQKRLQKK